MMRFHAVISPFFLLVRHGRYTDEYNSTPVSAATGIWRRLLRHCYIFDAATFLAFAFCAYTLDATDTIYASPDYYLLRHISPFDFRAIISFCRYAILSAAIILLARFSQHALYWPAATRFFSRHAAARRCRRRGAD